MAIFFLKKEPNLLNEIVGYFSFTAKAPNDAPSQAVKQNRCAWNRKSQAQTDLCETAGKNKVDRPHSKKWYS